MGALKIPLFQKLLGLKSLHLSACLLTRLRGIKARCIHVSLNYLITRRASELDILINKVNRVIHEDTLLLNELKKAQVAAFPEAYLQPSKGVVYIRPTTKYCKHFQIPKQRVMANKKLIMTLETYLKTKQYKTIEDEDMIKLLGRYLKDAETNFLKTQSNTNSDLDDDEQKKDDQKPSGSNPSQPSKATGSKTEDKKRDDEKRGDERRRKKKEDVRDERREKQKAEKEERGRKYAVNISMFEQRTNELKAKGMSRISKDGHFLNIKVGRFSRFRVGYLNGYSLDDWIKLVEDLRGTKIIEELQVLVNLKDLIRKESGYENFM
ncbi:hypothetical protein AgCh_025243 [Apium graveolens]